MKSKIIIGGISMILFAVSCKQKGCTQEIADNYHPSAEIDDGSCIFEDSLSNDLLLEWTYYYHDEVFGNNHLFIENQCTDKFEIKLKLKNDQMKGSVLGNSTFKIGNLNDGEYTLILINAENNKTCNASFYGKFLLDRGDTLKITILK